MDIGIGRSTIRQKNKKSCILKQSFNRAVGFAASTIVSTVGFTAGTVGTAIGKEYITKRYTTETKRLYLG